MMVPKAKLEISRSSTIVIKEVFAKSQWIRSYRYTNLRCQSSVARLKLAEAARRRGRPAIGRGHRVAHTR